MPKKIYFINPDQSENVEISWGFNFKNTTVKYNGTELGVVKNQSALKKGAEFNIDESRILSIQLKGMMYPDLEILINGQPIPGSATEPVNQLKQVVNFAFGIGIFSAAAGLFAELLTIEFLLNNNIGIENVIFGVIIIGLAFWLKQRSVVALSLIIGLIAFDAVGVFIMAAMSGTQVNPSSGLIVKVFFLIYLFKGFAALKKLKAIDERSIPDTALTA